MAFARRGKNGNGDYGGTYQKRTAWTAEEDEILKQQVARFGTHCWPEVAAGLSGRTSKACSLRWRCFLSPNIIRPNDEPFSPWEIAIIVLTQKVFGNKWNDIAAYLPMRCNNDIKNYFNLYLKEKTSVFSENCYLRSGYDLAQLLQAEPDEVMQRRQRLEAEKATNNNIDPLKVPPRSLSPLPRKPSTPTKAKKASSSGPSSPSVRGGVVKGAKPSRMGLAAGSLSAMMSEGYCLDGSYAGYSTDASGMYHSQDMAAATAAAEHSAYLASMNSQGMYGSPAAVAAYYGSPAAVGQAPAATAAGYTGGVDNYTMHLGATASSSFAAELQQQQQQQQRQQASNQQQQQQGVVAMDVSTSAAGCGPAPVTSLLLTAAVGSGAFDSSMLPPADKCATGTPALSAAKVVEMQHHSSSVCGGSPNDSSIYSPLMRFSIGDPDNILPVEADHNDPIAAAMGVHWHRITSMDGTDFDSLLSEGGGELHAELQLTRMLAEYEPSVTSKPHSNAGSAGTCTESPTSTKPVAEHTAQQDIDMGCIKAEAAAAAAQETPMSPPAAAAIDPAAAAAAPVDGPLPAVTVTVSRAAAEALAGAAKLQQQALLSPAAVAGALTGGHLQHSALHVDVPSPSVSCGAPSQQQQQQPHMRAEPAVSSPQAATGYQKLHGSGGNDSSSGSPGSMHLSSVNINLGLVNPAIAHLVAGGERNATSAPCTMVAAYTPNGTCSPNPALPKGAFTQGSLRPHSPTSSWQQAQQAAAHPQLSGLSAGQRPSPFKDLQHQQHHMHAMSDASGFASPTTSHQQHSHLLSGMYSAASSHQQLQLHVLHHQQQHMQSSSLLSSPATLAAAAGAAAAASGAFSSPLRSCAWAGSSAGVHSGEPQQQEQQQQPASAAAAAAAAIHSTGRWSQHNEGPLPLEVTHEDEADLARLFDGDSDVAMASAPAASAPSTAAAATAAAAVATGACTSPVGGSGGGAVGEAAAHDCTAKLESLIEELQTGAAPSSRLGSAPLNEVAGELLALPAWGSSSSGSLDHILSGDCW